MGKLILTLIMTLGLAGVAQAHPQHLAHLEVLCAQAAERGTPCTSEYRACYLSQWHQRTVCTEVGIQELTLAVGEIKELYRQKGRTYVIPAVHLPIFNYLHTIPIDPPGEQINDVYFCQQHQVAEQATCAWAAQAIADVQADKAKFLKEFKVDITRRVK